MNRVWYATLMVGLLSGACGGGNEAAPAAGPAPAATPSASSAPAPEPQSAGSVTFVVDGRAKSFDHLAAGDNYYTSLASAIRATPSTGGREQFAITFMSIDLRKQSYPVELPAPRASAPRGNPLAAMANVGFSYTDEDGREWAGPGRLRIESFGSDGVVVGAFSDVSLPHTGKALPNVTLADGTVRARISAPW